MGSNFILKHISLGNYSSFDMAVKARRAAESAYNFHENHGRTANV